MPSGFVSASCTDSAGPWPLFPTARVYVTVSPGSAFAGPVLSTVRSGARSADIAFLAFAMVVGSASSFSGLETPFAKSGCVWNV